MGPHEPADVDDVLGEHDATADVAPPEDPRRAHARLLRSLPMGDEVLEDLDEVGTVQGHLDRRHPQGDAAEAVQVHDVRDHLGQGGQPLLGGGGPGAGETQAAQDGLLPPAPLRGGVDQGLMLEELLQGERVGAGARPEADPPGARRGQARKPRVTPTRSGSKRPASRARSHAAAASASGASGAGPGSTLGVAMELLGGLEGDGPPAPPAARVAKEATEASRKAGVPAVASSSAARR